MSSINQSSSFASSIARCYRVCCGEAPRRYNSGCGSGDASPNSRLPIDMTDSTDRNKAVSPRMTGNFFAAHVIRSGRPRSVRHRSIVASVLFALRSSASLPSRAFLRHANRSSRRPVICQIGLGRRL